MIDDEILQRVLKKTLSNGGEYADIFMEQRSANAVQLEDNRVEKVISGSRAGVSIRLICNGRTAYA